MRLSINDVEQCILKDTSILEYCVKEQDSILCTYRRMYDIGDHDTVQEVYKAAADVHDIILLSPLCDQSSADVQYLHSMRQAFKWAESMSLYREVYNEYMYFIKHNEKLAIQVANIMLFKPQTHEQCIQVVVSHLSDRYASFSSNRPVHSNTYTKYGSPFVSGDELPIVFVRHNYLFDFKRCIAHMSRSCMNPFTLTHIPYKKRHKLYSQKNSSLDTQTIQNVSGMYNMFHIYRRCVNINLLPDAPYGTVSMHVHMLYVNTDTYANATQHIMYELRQTTAIFLTHVVPMAYETLEQNYDNDTAVVCLANLDSLHHMKRHSFYNRAIYMHDDIDAAAYMRFGTTQIAYMLKIRLTQLRSRLVGVRRNSVYAHEQKAFALYTNNSDKYVQLSIQNAELHVFFHRGVVNMRFKDTGLCVNVDACKHLSELIDIYRNVHWLGVNIFHHDISVIFPRIMARLGGCEEITLANKNKICVYDITNYLISFIRKIQESYEQLKQQSPMLVRTYVQSIHSAMQNPLFMARENLRLTFSMTHHSVHQYFDVILRDKDLLKHGDDCSIDNLCKYIMIAILYSGKKNCKQCQYAYFMASQKFEHERVSDSDLILLSRDIDKRLHCVNSLYTEYSANDMHFVNVEDVNTSQENTAMMYASEYIRIELRQRKYDVSKQALSIDKQQFDKILMGTQSLLLSECLCVFQNVQLQSSSNVATVLRNMLFMRTSLHVYSVSDLPISIKTEPQQNLMSVVIICDTCNTLMIQKRAETQCYRCLCANDYTASKLCKLQEESTPHSCYDDKEDASSLYTITEPRRKQPQALQNIQKDAQQAVQPQSVHGKLYVPLAQSKITQQYQYIDKDGIVHIVCTPQRQVNYNFSAIHRTEYIGVRTVSSTVTSATQGLDEQKDMTQL